MKISNGTAYGDVEYTQHAEGTWSFILTVDGESIPIESGDWNFATEELAEEQVNYTLDSAAL